MPNWIKGTLKLRGKFDDIRRFLNEGLDASTWVGENNDINDQRIDDSTDTCLDFTFKDEPHIAQTRRAFITDDSLYLNDCKNNKDLVACLNVKQAWGFVCDDDDKKAWRDISDRYQLDLKLYGIEMGMEFCEEVIVLRGQRNIIFSKIHYEDWDWDCPFPNMGG